MSEKPVDIEQYIDAFDKQGIDYSPNHEHEQFRFTVSEVGYSSSFYRINVELGHFSMELLVASTDSFNPFREEQSVKGCYGQVYFPQFQNQ
jgi:hypothetical protein